MKHTLFTASVFFYLILTGCWNPFNPPQGEFSLYRPPDNPENVIYNLQAAYMGRDLEGYLACLDRDSFKFYFDSREDSIAEILREYWGLDSLVWGYTEERLATMELFSAVNTINLNLFKRSFQYDTSGGRVYSYYDYILTIDPPPPNVDVAEGRALFILKKNPKDGYWYIITWQDYSLQE